MVTGPLYDDLAVLQACRAYEEAAGHGVAHPGLTAALAKAEGAPDAALGRRSARSPLRHRPGVKRSALGCGPSATSKGAERWPGMELYTAGTGNGQRAAIAVNECGVGCTIHVLNLGQGDQKRPIT